MPDQAKKKATYDDLSTIPENMVGEIIRSRREAPILKEQASQEQLRLDGKGG